MASLKATISNQLNRDGQLDRTDTRGRERLDNAGTVVGPDGRSRELFPVAIGVNDPIDPTILGRDRVLPWDVPYDVLREGLRERSIIARRACFILSAEKLLVLVHARTLSNGLNRIGTRKMEEAW